MSASPLPCNAGPDTAVKAFQRRAAATPDEKGTAAVELSIIGRRMASMSGLRSIMEDIATATAGPDADQWLNLSIGNPAPIPEAIATWQRLTERALAGTFAEASCRYGPSRGAPPLVRAIADYFNGYYGWDIGENNIIIGPGSQMLCFIAAALYTGPGRSGRTKLVLPMMPDYTGYQSLCMNPGGITGIASRAEKSGDRYFRYEFDMPIIQRCDDMGMMLLSSPSNPTGRSVAADELESLVRIAEARGAPLLLDHAYGEPFPQISRTLTPPVLHPNVINCFSFSKAGLPGERIGFAIGPEQLITPMVSFLSNSALHASRLAQSAIAIALQSGELDTLVSATLKPFYATRRKAAEKLLLDAMPPGVDWRLHSAEGGMFAWLWVNENWFDDLSLYSLLKRKHVFVAPGRGFFTGLPQGYGESHPATQCFRVSLTTDEGVLTEGIRRIADAVAELRDTAGAVAGGRSLTGSSRPAPTTTGTAI